MAIAIHERAYNIWPSTLKRFIAIKNFNCKLANIPEIDGCP